MNSDFKNKLIETLSLIRAEYNIEDALVFGSSLQVERFGDSDVDLICTWRNESASQETIAINDLTLDIYFSNVSELKKSLEADIKTNNNYVLFGCATGLHLSLGSDHLLRLMSLAGSIWGAGPRKVEPPEARLLQKALLKLTVTTGRLSEKHPPTPSWEGYANLKISQLFLHALYAYCRAHRLWASSLDVILGWQDPQYVDLQRLCREYLRSPEIRERCGTVTSLALSTLSTLDEISGLAAESRFPWKQKLTEIQRLTQTCKWF